MSVCQQIAPPVVPGAPGRDPRTHRGMGQRTWLAAFCVIALQASPLKAAEPTAYRVAPGDRIGITVFGQADMSGETMIDASYSIAVPLLGAVSVRGLTLKEIEQRLTKNLADGYLQKPVVSVRLTEPRPIYIVGDVRTAGVYPYRYGVSVLGAVALAGGFAVPEEQARAALRTDFVQADERVKSLEATRLTLAARRIRLEAQRDGRNPDFDSLESGRGSDEFVAQLKAGEAQLHAFQTSALQQQVEMLQQQEPRLLENKRFVQEQLNAEKRQLELIQQHLVDYNALLSSGLARRYTGIELQREEARNRGNIARFNAEMSNIALAQGELSLRVREAREAFQRRVWTEMQDAVQRLAELDAALPAARLTRELRLRQVGFAEGTSGPPRRSLFVTRQTEQGSETSPIAEGALLEPGDILRVERQREAESGQPPTAAAMR
ncbi:polysaccharide biosynthesis/export family protein [Bosea sp. WAO]|uniref:polysaccharide biosynthesis/export family protein n=1 Tax=Bosea sp. WAO TaxID=406341 RepID=UPI00160EA87B|nr:polysaccharide biosynthesis/export family protein [Bosea sp. WAO]